MSEPGGVSERLEGTLKRKGMSIRRLSRELEALGLDRGVSYSSVRNYVNGQQKPRPDVLDAMADVLGVSARWLEEGEGGRARVEDTSEGFAVRTQEGGEWLFNRIFRATKEWPGLPWPIGACLQKYLVDLYQRKGLSAVVPENGSEEPVESERDVRMLDILATIEREFAPALSVGGLSYGEIMAAFYSTLAARYLEHFGSDASATYLAPPDYDHYELTRRGVEPDQED